MQGNSLIRLVMLMLITSLACSSPIRLPGGVFDGLIPGGTWYVTTSGNDSNDCLSVATACRTVKAAVAKVATGIRGTADIKVDRLTGETQNGSLN